MKKLYLLVALLAVLKVDALAQPTNPLRITCPPNQTNWHCGVASTAIVTYPAPTTSADCPTNAIVTCTPPSGAVFILGTTTVSCRATNSCRESALCTFTVTVARDTTPPVIQCPPNQTNALCGSASTTPVVFPAPIATDNADTNVAVSCSPPSGAAFPIGNTIVLCTATDNCTNQTTCTFLVSVVRDTTPPTIQCPSNSVFLACDRSGRVVNYPTPVATDNLDPSPTVVCSPPSGQLFPPGSTTVTCTASDACINRSVCSFTVTVNTDTTPPIIQCPSNIVLWTCSTSAITPFGVTATDDFDLDVKINCIPPVGAPLPVGVTTVQCVAEDDCGNTNPCSFQVQVNRDTTPPTIECPSNMVFNCICPGNTIVLDFFKPVVTDTRDPNPTVVCVPPSLVSSPGIHPVVCTATDNCGNSNQCSFTVTFNYDTTPPVLACPTNMIIWTCNSNAVVNYSASATDVCDANVDVVCTPPSGSTFSIGTTVVVCTATDNCTNRSTCTFTVTVNRDTQPPSLICPTNVVTSICTTCAVSQCIANVPSPIRPTSVGNGLFYGADVEPDMNRTDTDQEILQHEEAGYHPIHVNAYQPPGQTGTIGVRYGIAWVRDDDSAFPHDAGLETTAAQLQAAELAQHSLRPVSLSGYKTSANQTRFAVAYLHDDSAYPWRLILDRDFNQYQAEIEVLAAQGFRPISVSGYSFDGVNPRYSGIFVQDGLTGSDWITSHGIPEADYQDWIDGWWDNGFRPISISAYTAGDETFFTAVMVRVPNTGGYVARHGLTENELIAENDVWTNPANNEYNTTFRPVVTAAYRSFGSGGAKRYAAVWRSSAPRAFNTTGAAQPSLSAFDTALQSLMQDNDINAATLCVSKDGGIVLHRGYTWAPGEFKQAQPCSRFRIASASKAVTAVAVMKLLEGNYLVGMKAGGLQALTLDTPVFQMAGMPDLPAAYGSTAQGITIRQLLQHRAGWNRAIYEPLYNDINVAAALAQPLPLTRGDMIEFMMTPAIWPIPNIPISVGYQSIGPANDSTYSNFGFSILAELIAVVSNQSYETFVRNNVLLPVGANRTLLGRTARLLALNGPDEVTYTAGVSDFPRWYVSDSNYDPQNVGNPTVPSAVYPNETGPRFPTSAYGANNIHTIDAAGGWVATSDDLVRLMKSFDDFDPAVVGTDTLLLDWNSVREMWTDPANIYNVANVGTYSLGWLQATINTPAGAVQVHYHGGNIFGAFSIVARRSDGVCFAAMFSRDGGGAFTRINNVINAITNWPVCQDGAVVSFPPPVVSDNADVNVSVVCVPPSGSYFPLGFHSVTCTATDNCGNQRTCQFRVTVKADNTPPAIQCPTNRVVWTCSTNGAVVTFPSPSVDDDTDPSPSVVCTPASGSLFPVGRTTVTCTATDDCTNRSSCTFTVTVNADTVPPIVYCPPGQVTWTCNPNGVPVNFPPPLVFDNRDANPSVVCVPPSGSVFPIGRTDVTCTATDNCTNRSSCVFAVVVTRDTNAPTIQCPENVIVWSCSLTGLVVNYPAPSANDDLDAAPAVVCQPPSGSVFPQGTTAVMCNATDDCGNFSSCSFQVRVAPDTTPPVVTCPDDRIRYTCQTNGGPAVFTPPEATDNEDPDPAIVCTPAFGDLVPLGITVVTCVATDQCGNTNACSFKIDMRLDTIPPVIVCPSNIVLNTCDAGGTTVSWPDFEVTDNFIINPQYSCTPKSGSIFPIGMTTVHCEAWDSCGNRSQCSFKVTIVPDAQVPGTDIDQDGLGDIWQTQFNAHGLAPGEDTDGDGLTNADEARAGTDPFDASFQGGVRVAVGDVTGDGLGDGSVRPVRFSVSTALGKRYQLQYAMTLGAPWRDWGTALIGTGFRLTFNGATTLFPTNPPQVFVRVAVSDVDADGDGVTAWEESIIGTSDLTADTRGTRGGDHQAALDYSAAQNSGPARLREVAAAHVGGSPQGPTAPILVTAAGTGGFFKLSSWTVNGAQQPVHLQDTAPTEGYRVKLHTLTPNLSPNLTLNLLVNGRVREDDNMWLTIYRAAAGGALSSLATLGYGANASFSVIDYAIAHRPLSTSDTSPVTSFQVVTPVIGRTTANQLQLRVISWSVNPVTGNLIGTYDTGDLSHTDVPEDGGFLQIRHLDGQKFVVSYSNRTNELSQWFFDVNAQGVVFPRGGQVSGMNLRGDQSLTVPTSQFALEALNERGFMTATFESTNCALKLITWEERITACDAGCSSQPFYITDSTLDQQPQVNGVQLPLPTVTDSHDDTFEADEFFGQALAVGDFDGDGIQDAAIGAYGENSNAGAVTIRYGTADGFSGTAMEQFWYQDSDGIQGTAESGDYFGFTLAAGDFNGDGRDDLAIGAPREDIEADGIFQAGVVHVLYGSASGLTATGSQLWMQGAGGLPGTQQSYDWFGDALSAGDFNGDGRDDLVIGIPREHVGGVVVGAVQIIYGAANGLSAGAGPGDQLWHQDSAGVLGAADEYDFFGASLATGDFNGDNRDDLAIGIPREEVGGQGDAGAVQVIYGSAAGLASANNQLISQDQFLPGGADVPGAPEVYDQFGRTLAAGDFNGDGRDDLAVGVPDEDVDVIEDAGAVQVFYGSVSGLSAAGAQLFTQDSPGIESAPEPFDAFGRGLTAGDFNGDGRAELAIGSATEGVSALYQAGVVHVLPGAAAGLTGTGSQLFHQNSEGIKDDSEAEDYLGWALAAGDFNDDGRADLLVGIPGEDFNETDDEPNTNAGAVAVLYGSASGVSNADHLLTQGVERKVRALLTDKRWEQTYGVYGGKLFEQMPAGETTNVHAASVTKSMTLLLTVEALLNPASGIALNNLVTVSADAANTGGSFMGNEDGTENDHPLLEGDVMPLNLLMWGMMINSCNKASRAIAEHVGATYPGAGAPYEKFIARMNEKADDLQMLNTQYSHPAHGGVTTPYDLTLLMMHAWQHPLFRQFVGPHTDYLCGKDANGEDKCYSFNKSTTYPGLEGWKGGNIGFTVPGFPVPFCTSCWLGHATRLNRSLIVALQQSGSSSDRAGLFDYGYQLLFTPDYRGGHQMNGPSVTDFVVRCVNDTLAFTAIVDTQNRLRVDTWQVVAGIGQVAPLGNHSLTFNDLGAGTHLVAPTLLDLTSLPTIESEADYISGHLENGRLRLDVWRVAAEPGQ